MARRSSLPREEPMSQWKRAGAACTGLLLVVLAWGLGAQPLPVAKPEQVGMSSQKLAKIGKVLKKEADDGSFRGAVGMVTRKGKLVYQDAVGMQTVSAQMTVQDLLRPTSGLAYGEITQNAPVKEGLERAGAYRKDLDFDARNVTPDEEIAGMAKVPLAFQPGTTWNYSVSTDMLGRVVEKASGKRLADFLDERLFKPLGMKDSGFWEPAAKMPRLAESPEKDRFAGRPFPLIDVSAPPKNDSGGAGGVSTAADYLRFSQMMMNGGVLDGKRVLSRTTVRLMTSDHLGGAMALAMDPGMLLLGSKGYGFGLGFSVRLADGVAAVPGAAGEYRWAGYGGTYFWVDPKEQVTAVLMTQAASPQRAYFRKQV